MKTIFVELSKEKLDLIIKALSKVEYKEEDFDKEMDGSFAGQCETYAEELDILFTKEFK